MIRRLVVVAVTSKPGERAGAGLGVMALGVAALADGGRRRNIDLAKQRLADAAGRSAVLAGGRDGSDHGDMSVSGEVRCDLGKSANIFAAVFGRKTEIAVE